MKKIDRWVGRHMSRDRWAFVWSAVAGSGTGLLIIIHHDWWWLLGISMMAVGALMVWGNARRLR